MKTALVCVCVPTGSVNGRRTERIKNKLWIYSGGVVGRSSILSDSHGGVTAEDIAQPTMRPPPFL